MSGPTVKYRNIDPAGRAADLEIVKEWLRDHPTGQSADTLLHIIYRGLDSSSFFGRMT